MKLELLSADGAQQAVLETPEHAITRLCYPRLSDCHEPLAVRVTPAVTVEGNSWQLRAQDA